MDEFSTISKYIAPLAAKEKGAFGLKDDAAILPLPQKGLQHVVTKDAILEGTHFFHNTNPRDIAHKILGVNLSDIAAMGAVPKYYFMSALLNRNCDEQWIKNLTDELNMLQNQYNVTLMGGDTVFHDGDISLSITMIGEVETKKILLRSGAKLGDYIYVTGTIGDSALGLHLLKKPEIQNKIPVNINYLIDRYLRPRPRLQIAAIIKAFASSATDISDGLIADMENICKTSNIGAELYANMIPVSNEVNAVLNIDNSLKELIYSGGDDYELIFTIPNELEEDMLKKISKSNENTPITKIGKIIEGNKCILLDKDNQKVELLQKGYVH